ncbi:MAG: bifunctional alpha,alpha-trehalose-phosphate synthase (UDP-forming)/trehalose-phosphatase, partial [Endomicrobiia bacterium]
MRLIIVSNRLPFTIKKLKTKIEFKESSGGLATGISSYLESLKSSSFIQKEHLWIGWCGTTIDNNFKSSVKKKALNDYNALPVFLDETLMEKFYTGFCNKTIWPLFHCFSLYTHYEEESWTSYKQVNELFCDNIVKIIKPNDIIWIQDYHLMLLPKLIREKIPEAQIGFFLHIPFPPHEIFRLLPKTWRAEILEGLLGADLVGFHTNDYTQNFFKCVLRILGLEQNLGTIVLNDRIFRADTFPMGIHFNKFFEAATLPQTIKEKELFAQMLKNVKTILSVDRLDYTKGILNRLEGFDLFLEKNVQWHKKVTFLLMVIPSRIGVDNYQRMKTKIDESVGKINGRFGAIDWTPVVYQYKHLPFHTLVALYNMCDVGLITPLRDGMNLVAKEFLAAKTDKTGVLILSEMAGAAKELGEAIIINPNHKEEIASSIKDALEMPLQEQQQRNEIMQKRIQSYDVIHWAEDFITELNDINKIKNNYKAKILSTTEKNI